MSIKVSKYGSTVTIHPMLVQNVATFSGMHGMFKNSVHPLLEFRVQSRKLVIEIPFRAIDLKLKSAIIFRQQVDELQNRSLLRLQLFYTHSLPWERD